MQEYSVHVKALCETKPERAMKKLRTLYMFARVVLVSLLHPLPWGLKLLP